LAAFAWIIPFEGDACEFVAGHVELYPMVLFENIEEKFEVLDPHVFHTKIINNEAELDGTPFVIPNSWGGDGFVESFCDQS
jgi:hypothetical protein